MNQCWQMNGWMNKCAVKYCRLMNGWLNKFRRPPTTSSILIDRKRVEVIEWEEDNPRDWSAANGAFKWGRVACICLCIYAVVFGLVFGVVWCGVLWVSLRVFAGRWIDWAVMCLYRATQGLPITHGTDGRRPASAVRAASCNGKGAPLNVTRRVSSGVFRRPCRWQMTGCRSALLFISYRVVYISTAWTGLALLPLPFTSG